MKYAIYKTKIGLRAVEYLDTKESIKPYPYIKEDSLPVLINDVGGYCSFIEKYEIEDGFVEIIECDEDTEPLTREQRYPKNSELFEYGWIDTDGNTYATPHEGHSTSASVICDELGLEGFDRGERKLEKLGWAKVTGSWKNGELCKIVYTDTYKFTQKQIDTLFDLGLDKIEDVRIMIKYS